MLIDAAIQHLDHMISTLEKELPKISEEIAMNAIALVINRIQQQGIPGKSYSENKLPVFFFEDRELNAGGRALIDRHKKKRQRDDDRAAGIKVRKNARLDELAGGIDYREWRIANGLQVDHIDLTFTGRMFQNVGIVGTVITNETYITVIGGFDKEVKDKLRWNAQQFGDFFLLTKEEHVELIALLDKRLQVLGASLK
jgi:hypothetical protein